MRPIEVSTTIPDPPVGFVPRDNVNMTIDTMLDGQADAVLLQGPDGVGKSTILNSYARSRADYTISLFLRPARSSYETSTVMAELFTQLIVALGTDHSIAANLPVTRSELTAALHKLATHLRIKNRRFVFVVDGLADVRAKDLAAAREILELLPFGRRTFRFLFSGAIDDLLTSIGCRLVSYPVTLFSLEETRQLFSGLSVSDGDVIQAHHSCNGVVGQLAAVRRLFASGLSIGEILRAHPGDLGSTMELEWTRSAPLTSGDSSILAVLAFDARPHTHQSLAHVLDSSPDVVEAAIRAATFLTQRSDNTIDFISETFRTFTQRRLERYRQSTLERLIAQLLPSLSEHDSVTILPHLMSEAKQHQPLVSLLTTDFFASLLRVSDSLTTLTAHAALGAQSAEALSDDVGVYRLRLTQSLAADVLRSSDKRDELVALAAVGRSTDALDLARGASFKEERLVLLASAVAAMSDRGDEIDVALRDELKQLCETAPVELIGDGIIDVAGDVFAVDPESALQLVDRFGATTNRANTFDWVMAALSVRHAMKGRRTDAPAFAASSLHERFADSALQTVFETAGFANSTHGASWILERAAAVADVSARLSVLRMWLQMHYRRPDAITVSAFALELAVKTPEYAVTVPVLRQFASPLPYASDSALAADIIGRTDALLTSLPHRSPTVEYVRLQLLLARAQAGVNADAAQSRVLELYFFVEGLADIAIKAECLARLYVDLPTIWLEHSRDQMRAQLLSLIDDVLRHSAIHDDVVYPIIRPLLRSESELAFSIVDKLNTDFRRDAVRGWLIEELAGSRTSDPDPALMREQLGKIRDITVQTSTLIAALAGASTRQAHGDALASSLWDYVDALSRPEDRAVAFTYLARILHGRPSGATALSRLTGAVESLTTPAVRAHCGFFAARRLAQIDQGAAKTLLDSVRAYRESQPIPLAGVGGYVSATRLAARALGGLFETDAGFEEELTRVLDMCRSLPDVVARVIVLSELAHAAFRGGRRDIVEKLHRDHLWHCLEEARQESVGRYYECLLFGGWIVFLCHERAFMNAVQQAPDSERERIVRSTALTFLRGACPTEPRDERQDYGVELTEKSATDIIALLELVDDDALIFRAMRTICRWATSRRTRITREARAMLLQSLTSLIQKKLPSRQRIRHDGYKWACVAELMSLGDEPESDWVELIGNAKAIPNIPDSAYTLALIANAMPRRFETLRQQAIQQAVDIAKSVTIATERAECFINIADAISGRDLQLAKQLLQQCAPDFLEHDGYRDDGTRIERLLDVAYRISPDFALALSSELDTDAARSEIRRELRQAKRAVEMRKRLLEDAVGPSSQEDRPDGRSLARAAWRNLGALNANSVVAKPPQALRSSMWAAGQWPIAVTYAVFAWVIQNWASRPRERKEKVAALRGLAQSSMVAGELVRVFGSEGVLSRPAREVVDSSVRSVGVVEPGDRPKALQLLRDWCQRTSLEYLKISDPFFGPDELELIRLVAEHNPNCAIKILTSRKHLNQLRLGEDVAAAFEEAWHRISLDAPPPTEIVIAGIPPQGKSPVHDRWWIGPHGALDFGTSANAFGGRQAFSIKELDSSAATAMEAQLDRYLTRSVRHADNGRISYFVISL